MPTIRTQFDWLPKNFKIESIEKPVNVTEKNIYLISGVRKYSWNERLLITIHALAITLFTSFWGLKYQSLRELWKAGLFGERKITVHVDCSDWFALFHEKLKTQIKILTSNENNNENRELPKILNFNLRYLSFIREDADSLYRIGKKFQEGSKTIQQNKDKALKFFTMAAERNHFSSMYELAVHYDSINDHVSAFQWAQKASRGNNRARVLLGKFYRHGKGCEKSLLKAFKCFSKGAEIGDPSSMLYLGLAYKRGEGVEKSEKIAFEWFKKAADKGDVSAIVEMAELYIRGLGDKNLLPTELFQLHIKAATLGNSRAMYYTGMCYKVGFGVEQSYLIACEWWIKAAHLEIKEALKELYNTYWNGFMEHHIQEYSVLLAALEAKGNKDAIYQMGLLCFHGRVANASYQIAFQKFRTAAEAGHPGALRRIGYGYFHGIPGVLVQSYGSSFEYYLKAANAGDSEGMFMVANFYKTGNRVVEVNMEEYFLWLKKSAEHNFVLAMKELSHCYIEGIGVEKSADEGIKWLLEAAKGHNAMAHAELSVRYEIGDLVDVNLNLAGHHRQRAMELGYQFPQPMEM